MIDTVTYRNLHMAIAFGPFLTTIDKYRNPRLRSHLELYRIHDGVQRAGQRDARVHDVVDATDLQEGYGNY